MALALTAAIVACTGKKAEQPAAQEAAPVDSLADSCAIYGLACDGLTDTILVLLRNPNNDPDTFNILQATRHHAIFGRPMIGDHVAVIPSATDSTVADMVINLEQLRGQWGYTVMPSLRPRADHPKASQSQLLALLPDSVRREVYVPHEYGIYIRDGYHAQTLGLRFDPTTSDEESPVIYEEPKHYGAWRLSGGQLVLTEMGLDSLGNRHELSHDTAQFVYLQDDSLALRFGKTVQGFRKLKVKN